jgi:hypothetical protein
MDDAERRRLEERGDALNERLDRFFAFRRPTEQTLEDRVQLLEREVVLLFRLVTLLSVAGARPSLKNLERIERALDEAEGRQTHEPSDGS